MFTLKLYSPAMRPGPRDGQPGESPYLQPGDTLTWIADVTMVTVVARGAASDFVVCESDGGLPPRILKQQDAMVLYQPEHFFSSGATDLSLIIVSLNDREFRNLLVDHAWLLGEGGRTIERISP